MRILAGYGNYCIALIATGTWHAQLIVNTPRVPIPYLRNHEARGRCLSHTRSSAAHAAPAGRAVVNRPFLSCSSPIWPRFIHNRYCVMSRLTVSILRAHGASRGLHTC
jgi:hypothetical protein